MNEFAHTLGHVLRRPSFAPVQEAVALRPLLGAERAEALLTGPRATPARLQARRLVFQLSTLEAALKDALSRTS